MTPEEKRKAEARDKAKPGREGRKANRKLTDRVKVPASGYTGYRK